MLDMREAWEPPAYGWAQMFSHQALRGLTTLALASEPPCADFVEIAAAHLPRLRGLMLHKFADVLQSAFFCSLPRLLQLSEVFITDDGSCSIIGDLGISAWPQLRTLSLRKLHDSCFNPLLGAPALQYVECLSLDHVWACHGRGVSEPPSPIGWSAIFANLRHLRVLRLHCCHGVDAIVSALAEFTLADLQQLIVQRTDLDDYKRSVGVAPDQFTLPSPSSLLQLLHAHPLLRIDLHLLSQQSVCGFVMDDAEADAFAASWSAVFACYSELTARSSRVSVLWGDE